MTPVTQGCKVQTQEDDRIEVDDEKR